MSSVDAEVEAERADGAESLRVVSKQASSGGRVSFVVRRDSAENVGGGAGKSTSQVVGLFGRIP